MSKQNILKRKGISVFQKKKGDVALMYKGSEIKSLSEFLEIVIVSPTNNLYKTDISYIRDICKKQATQKGDNAKGLLNKLNVDFKIENLTDKIKTTEDKYNSSPEMLMIPYRKEEGELYKKLSSLKSKTKDEFINEIIDFTVKRYIKIYNKTIKLYKSKEVENDSIKNSFELSDIDSIKSYIHTMLNNNTYSITFQEKKRKTKCKKEYSVYYLTNPQNTKEISLKDYFYGKYIYPKIEGRNIRGTKEYKYYMYINDLFKMYVDRKHKNIREKVINIHEDHIRKFMIARIYNKKMNQSLSLPKKVLPSGKRLKESYEQSFISSLQECIFFGTFILNKFIDTNQSNSDITMGRTEGIQVKQLDNIVKNQAKYILNIDDNMNYLNFVEFIKCLRGCVRDLRNRCYHYKAGDLYDEKYNNNEEFRSSYKRDVQKYKEQLLIRANSNLLYKLQIENNNEVVKYLGVEESLTLIDESIRNVDKFFRDYSAPKARTIINQIQSVYFDEDDSEIRIRAKEYYLILQYTQFINSKEFLEGTLTESDDTILQKYNEQAKKRFESGNRVNHNYTNLLYDTIEQKYKSEPFIELKKKIQQEVDALKTDLYPTKAIREKNEKRAKKLLNQFRKYEIMLISEAFKVFLDRKKIMRIHYDDSKVEYNESDASDYFKGNNMNETITPFYALAKLVDKKHISMLVNKLCRLQVKYASLEDENLLLNESETRTIINNLLLLQSFKDNVEISEEVYKHTQDTYFTKAYIEEYLSIQENLDVKIVHKNIEKVNCYGYMNNVVKLDVLKETVEEPSEAYDLIRNHSRQQDKISQRETLQAFENIQKYQNYKNYTLGKPIMDHYYLVSELQSRFLRELFLIEKDVKIRAKQLFEFAGIEKEYVKDDLIKSDRLYKLLNSYELKGDEKAPDKIKALIPLKKELCRYNVMGIESFVKIRNIISHYSYFFDTAKSRVTISGTEFIPKILDNGEHYSLLSLMYMMLRYDLKKQNSFLKSVQKIFEKHNYIINFEVCYDDKGTPKVKVHNKIDARKISDSKSVKFHHDKTISYINETFGIK